MAYDEYGELIDFEPGIRIPRPDDLAGAVVAIIADRLMRSGDLAEIWQKVREKRDELILERVQDLVEERVEAAFREPIQRPRPRYGGEPDGDPTTLVDMLDDQIRSALFEKKRKDHRSEPKTCLERMIEREVEGRMNSGFKDALDGRREEVKAALRAEGADLLSETIARMAGKF